MDVLHVVHQFAPETRGGAESYTGEVARAQRARGLAVEVLTGSLQPWPEPGSEQFEVDGLPVTRMHRSDMSFDHHAKCWEYAIGERFRAVLRQRRPRTVHLHQWIRLSCDLVQICEAEGVPAVVTLHDFYTSCPRAFRMRPDEDLACRRHVGGANCWDCVPKYGHESRGELELGVDLFVHSMRAELSAARKVLVALASVADLLAAFGGAPRDRYTVLPFGYGPRWPGQPPLPAPAPGEPLRFAFWGGIGRHKGVEPLVAAFGRLIAGGARAELHMLGPIETPDLERSLHALAGRLPVTFHGAFTPAQLRAAAPHVGVFPSTCLETWSLVLDECRELGLPSIVSDHGALPERAGGSGLAVAPNDVDALAAAMRRLVDDPALWTRLRQALPRAPITLDEHVDRLLQIYHEAAAAPPMGFAPAVPLEQRLRLLGVQRDSAWSALRDGHRPS